MKTVDLVCDTDVWVPVPMEWSEDTWPDPRDWAREAAEAVFTGAKDRSECDVLALCLVMLAESPLLGPAQGQRAFVHLPGPTSDVLPVYLQVFQEEGERDDALRDLSGADDEDAVEPPIVEPFSAEGLGDGLRALRYSRHGDADALMIAVGYAFRPEGAGIDARIWTSHIEPGRVLRALDDIEALVHRAQVVDEDAPPGT